MWMENTQSLLAKWREANRSATEAELALFERTLVHLRGGGPLPTQQENDHAKHLRTYAAALMEQALAPFRSGVGPIPIKPPNQPARALPSAAPLHSSNKP
jgi:hypothetical protein